VSGVNNEVISAILTGVGLVAGERPVSRGRPKASVLASHARASIPGPYGDILFRQALENSLIVDTRVLHFCVRAAPAA